LPVDLQTLGLAAAPIEGEHQLGSKPLSVRVLHAQSFELADERKVAAQRQLCIHPLLDRRKP
jgi:hypothetical protein